MAHRGGIRKQAGEMTIDLQQRESRWVRKIRPCGNVLRNAELVLFARLTGGAGNYGIVPIGTCFLLGLSVPLKLGPFL